METNTITKANKWYNSLKNYNKEYLSKKHNINEFLSFDEWVEFIYSKYKIKNNENN